MSDITYFTPSGGLQARTELTTGRAVFTNAYAVIPKGVMMDIVTSVLPFWTDTRAWILARPMTGFAETFSQYIVEVSPGGGSERPDTEPDVESVLFVTAGEMALTLDGETHTLVAGGYAFLAPGSSWSVKNAGAENLGFHWIRKAFEFVDGLGVPDSFITSDAAVEPTVMPGEHTGWMTTRFADPADVRHDMHVNIVTFQPGFSIPFKETHVMEHGLYVLQGKGVYLLNEEWVEVEAGDFMWLRAFCPQACYAGGPGLFRYLLYKNVNRHPKFNI